MRGADSARRPRHTRRCGWSDQCEQRPGTVRTLQPDQRSGRVAGHSWPGRHHRHHDADWTHLPQQTATRGRTHPSGPPRHPVPDPRRPRRLSRHGEKVACPESREGTFSRCGRCRSRWFRCWRIWGCPSRGDIWCLVRLPADGLVGVGRLTRVIGAECVQVRRSRVAGNRLAVGAASPTRIPVCRRGAHGVGRVESA